MTGSVHRYKQAWARRIFPLCLCAFACTALVMAVPQRPAGAESSDVLNRIKRMENEIDTLNRAVYKGEAPPAAASGGAGSTADLEVRLGQIETDLRNLTGKVEQQAYDAQQIQQKLEALTQDSAMRLDAIEAQLRAAAAPPATTPLPPAVSPDPASTPDPAPSEDAEAAGDESGVSDAATLYEQGFAAIKKEDYAQAEGAFSSFMKQYPTHTLAPNALYWLGETYYVRKDYDKAARVFAESYQKFPKGPKGADNLLKLGMSLAGKGEKDNACIALGQLKKEYPNGPGPVLAKGEQEMGVLGCK